MERLLRELAPAVAPARQLKGSAGTIDGGSGTKVAPPALLHRLLWLLELQIKNRPEGTRAGAEGGGGEGECGERARAGWDAELLCERLQKLPVRVAKVGRIASRFMLTVAAPGKARARAAGMRASGENEERIDITNPLHRHDSVLVLDRRRACVRVCVCACVRVCE